MQIERVQKHTIVQQVMDQIKNLIAVGQFKPHDKIPTENELAELFGTGRTTIREAIKIFHHLGILESHPRKGTFVCDYSNISTEALTWSILLKRGEIFELIALREAIEQRTLEALTERSVLNPEAVAEAVKTLQGDIEDMKAAIADSSLGTLIEADYHFHGTIIGSYENTVFTSIYKTLRSFMHEEIKKTSMDTLATSATVKEHQAIVDAVKSGEKALAVQSLKEHINSTKEQLRQSLGLDQS